MSPYSASDYRDQLLQTLVLAGLASLWEVSSRAGWVHPFLLPPLSDVLVRLFTDMQSGAVFVDLGLTLYRALTGFMIAAMLAVPLGLLMARRRGVQGLVQGR